MKTSTSRPRSASLTRALVRKPLGVASAAIIALLVFAALALTVTMQTAVLTSAAVGVTLWWALGATERFRTRR